MRVRNLAQCVCMRIVLFRAYVILHFHSHACTHLIVYNDSTFWQLIFLLLLQGNKVYFQLQLLCNGFYFHIFFNTQTKNKPFKYSTSLYCLIAETLLCCLHHTDNEKYWMKASILYLTYGTCKSRFCSSLFVAFHRLLYKQALYVNHKF